MRFKSFWTLYLQHHSLPGTRALHYFATAISLLSAAEALATGRPLVLVAGVILGYAIAIGSHWLVERNRPLIRANAWFGALADLRMCWLALLGRLPVELKGGPLGERQRPTRGGGRRAAGRGRYALLVIAVFGLVAGLLDLHDMSDTAAGLHFPILQLGLPVLAFTAAIIAGAKSIGFGRLAYPSAKDTASFDRYLADSESLWQAHQVLLAVGAASMALAEFVEADFARSVEFYLAAGLLVVAIFLAMFCRRAAKDRSTA